MIFEEAPDLNGTIAYTNVGVSMMPLLREGRDVMVIRKRSPERLNYLDAVLYIRPHVQGRGHYVLHRILRVMPDDYWIVGDNCASGEYVPENCVLGVLTTIVRNGKPMDFDSWPYRLYLRTWIAPYRFRFFVLKVRNKFFRLGSFVKRRILRIPR